MKLIKIGRHIIGSKKSTFIIAEAGINHNGSLSVAKKMVDVAVKAKVSCIKFQTHITEKEMIKTNITPGNISKKTLWEIIKSCELSEMDEYKIKQYCKTKKILFLSTPFSKEGVDRLERLRIPAYKIGSGELTNIPFLEYIIKKKKPVILSTGMSTMNEIRGSVKLFKKKSIPLVLLQTTSTYPSRYDEIKLGMIDKLELEFKVPVGISDHSIGIYTALGAVARGAHVIEKHFTLNKQMKGPDQKFSLEPNELRELVIGCDAIKKALGNTKTILKNEKPIMKFARESVVTIKPVSKGEYFTTKNISTKRPGTGEIPANKFSSIINRIARKDLPEDRQIKWNDLI